MFIDCLSYVAATETFARLGSALLGRLWVSCFLVVWHYFYWASPLWDHFFIATYRNHSWPTSDSFRKRMKPLTLKLWAFEEEDHPDWFVYSVGLFSYPSIGIKSICLLNHFFGNSHITTRLLFLFHLCKAIGRAKNTIEAKSKLNMVRSSLNEQGVLPEGRIGTTLYQTEHNPP